MTENCNLDITPLKQSELLEKPSLERLDYTNQDFWSMKARLLDRIKNNFSDDFSDFIESDLAIMLIEEWAFVGDTLSFKIDQIANELFIDSATEVDNVFRLSELVGFKPLPPIGGRSFWTLTLINPLDSDLTLSRIPIVEVNAGGERSYLELFPRDSNNNPLLDEFIVIPTGATSLSNVIGIEGRTRQDIFVGSGESNQTLSLINSPVLFDSVRVNVDGASYVRVDAFTDSSPRREFRIEFNARFEAFIVMGSNRAGSIPALGSSIIATYRTGGGTIGNITTGSISTQQQYALADGALGYSVAVTFFNHTKGEFGYDGDGIEEVRRKLPAYLNTQNRTVSGRDYKNFADQFVTPFHGKVGKSTAVLRNHGCAANIIDLYILTQQGDNGLISSVNELKNDLTSGLNEIKMMTDSVCIKDGVVVEVDVALDIILDKFFKKFQDEFEERIRVIANSFFALHKWEYNQNLREGDLLRELGVIKEAKTINIDFQTDDEDNSGSMVSTKFFEIIRPDQLDINFTYE
jgi:hypothetical protein